MRSETKQKISVKNCTTIVTATNILKTTVEIKFLKTSHCSQMIVHKKRCTKVLEKFEKSNCAVKNLSHDCNEFDAVQQ